MEKIQLTRILIAEDDINFGNYLRDVLEGLGYLVIAIVDSGEGVVARASETRPDLVIMDILLKGDMDGVAAAEQIRLRYHFPVVFLTAYADPTTLQRARFAGPYGFLIKPFQVKQLQAVIELAVHKHKTEMEKQEESWPVHSLQQMAEAVLITDEQGRVRFMNKPAENMTGWQLAEASGKPWNTVFQTYHDMPGSLVDASVMTDSMSQTLGEHSMLLHRDGSAMTIDFSTAPLYGSSGFVIVFRNATSRIALETALADSRKRYRDLVNSVEGIVWEADGIDRQFTFVSKQAQHFLGFRSEEWTETTDFWKNHLHPEDLDWTIGFVKKALLDGTEYQIEYRMITRDNQVVWIKDLFHADCDQDHPVRFRGVLLNVTDAKRVEKVLRTAHDELEKRVHERTAELTGAIIALRESEERYALAVLGANDGLWDWNLKSGEVYYAARWKSMLGYHEQEIGNKSMEWFSRVHPEDIERVKAEIAAHLDGKTPQFESECRMLHRDGTFRWMLTRGVAVRDEIGPARIAGSQSDITERKLAEERLLHDAFYDGLTGLPNRALFLDRLSTAVVRAKSSALRGRVQSFAVLFLDLDRFKVVNDSLGHLSGDQLLIDIAKRLQNSLRPGDTIARLGGDEFTILVEDIPDIRGAVKVAERVQEELRLPFNLDGRDVFTTASIGIAMSTAESESAQELLRDADTAMYRAKEKGKARYEVFDKSMHGKAFALLQLETDLRRAIERNEFRIVYQPVVSLSNGRITGFEALIRWQHPERGILGPEEIIPLAEETGLIIPIGYSVLGEACRQMREWHKSFSSKFFLSVNISGRQFSQADLIIQIRKILQDTDFPPELLKLELTESVIMGNLELATSLLQKLEDLHIRLLIDDFGTGYSSLGYLNRFPIHALKIDKSFIGSKVEDENWGIVRAVIALSQNMGMETIAEGVETEEQRVYLLSLGCESGQGFLFSRPVDPDTVAVLLAEELQFQALETDRSED